jgi:hypothetical protein
MPSLAPVITMALLSNAIGARVCWDNASMQSVHGAGGTGVPGAKG